MCHTQPVLACLPAHAAAQDSGPSEDLVLKGEFKVHLSAVARPPSGNAQAIAGIMRLALCKESKE